MPQLHAYLHIVMIGIMCSSSYDICCRFWVSVGVRVIWSFKTVFSFYYQLWSVPPFLHWGPHMRTWTHNRLQNMKEAWERCFLRYILVLLMGMDQKILGRRYICRNLNVFSVCNNTFREKDGISNLIFLV